MSTRKTKAQLQSEITYWQEIAGRRQETIDSQTIQIVKLNEDKRQAEYNLACAGRLWNTWTLINRGYPEEPATVQMPRRALDDLLLMFPRNYSDNEPRSSLA